jgi:hypothetical protein
MAQQSWKQTLAICGFLIVLFLLLTVAVHQVFHNDPIGIDFLNYWSTGDVLFNQHADPYGPQVAHQNQMWIYGRDVLPGEDDLNFSNPLYFLLPIYPLSLFPYVWAQAIWMALYLTALLSLGLLFFQGAPKWIPLLFIFFYEVWFTVIIGNVALFVCLYLLIVMDRLLLREEKYAPWINCLIGVGLSQAMPKPQLVWLVFAVLFGFFLLRRKWDLIAGFASGVVATLAWSLAVDPHWMGDWYQRTIIYHTEGRIVPSLVWYLNLLMPLEPAWMVYRLSIAVLVGMSTVLFWRWYRGRLSMLTLIVLVVWFTNLLDTSSLSPDRNILYLPIFLWALRNAQTKATKITWGLALLVSNLGFVLSQIGAVPWAVERFSLIGYTVWLGYFLWTQRPDHQAPSVRTAQV